MKSVVLVTNKGTKMNETQKPEALRLADACDTLTKLMLVVPGLDTIEAAAELRRLHQCELAAKEWLYKTDWVQATAQAGELGMHRADVLQKRIETLTEANTALLAALKVAEVAIHEYRNLGAPHAYWDDVQHQAYMAIVKAEG